MQTAATFEDLDDFLLNVTPSRGVCDRNDRGELKAFDHDWLEAFPTSWDPSISPHTLIADVQIAGVPVHVTIIQASINIYLDLVGTWGRFEYQWSRSQKK